MIKKNGLDNTVNKLKTSLIEEILKNHTNSSKIRNWHFIIDLSISACAAREVYLTSKYVR